MKLASEVRRRILRLWFAGVLGALCVASVWATPSQPESRELRSLASELQVGDVVFIRIPNVLFRKVAEATGSWTNHVGVVIDVSGAEPVVAESRVFRAGTTSLSAFVARSEDGRIAVRRPHGTLTAAQNDAIVRAARQRLGRWYDTGFDLHSSRQFCSRYVYEVMQEALGAQVGEVQTFAQLLADRPQTDQTFWRLWFFGHIPWQRQTVTPASQLQSPNLDTRFDGYARQS